MGFLQRSGTDFVLDGQKHILFGGAIYGGWTIPYLLAQFKNATHANVNMVRLVNWQSYQANLDEFNEANWKIMDYAVAHCGDYGIKLLIDNSDFCEALRKRGFTYANQNWTAYLTFMLNRVNTVNGIQYKNDPNIGMFTIAGELGERPEEVPTLVSHVTSVIKSIDPNHLCGPGGLEINHRWEEIINIPTVDFGCTHPYGIWRPVIEGRLDIYKNYAKAANKPWFIEEIGYPLLLGEKERASRIRQLTDIAFKRNCAGFLIWNLAQVTDSPTTPETYNIGKNLPESWEAYKLASMMPFASSRITLTAYDKSRNWTSPYPYVYTPFNIQ